MIRDPAQLNVRRLAALDTHGARGTRRRRRVILAEFALGTIGSLALGVWALTWDEASGVVLGIWLLGLAANYLPLTAHVIALWQPAVLEAELAGANLGALPEGHVAARQMRRWPSISYRNSPEQARDCFA